MFKLQTWITYGTIFVIATWVAIFLGVRGGEYIIENRLLEDEDGPVEFRSLETKAYRPWEKVDPAHARIAGGDVEEEGSETMLASNEVHEEAQIEPNIVEVNLPVSEGDNYYLQFGFFTALPNAQKKLEQLTLAGENASIFTDKESYKFIAYSVRSLPFQSHQEAREEQERLMSRGLSTTLIMPAKKKSEENE